MVSILSNLEAKRTVESVGLKTQGRNKRLLAFVCDDVNELFQIVLFNLEFI